MDGGKQTRIESLTGLRYIAALSVLLAHTAGYLPPAWTVIIYYLSRSSALGMPLFFVLSGFLMTYNYGDEFAARCPGALRKFIVARLSRIYPVYLIALLLSISFLSTFFSDLVNRPAETLCCCGFLLTLTQSWVHVPVFEGTSYVRTVALSYNAVGWSVSTEAFFYVLFPLLAIKILPLIKSSKGAIAVAINTVGIWIVGNVLATHIVCPPGVLFENYHHSGREWLFYLSPYARLGEFLVGCFAGRLYQLRSETPVGRAEGIGARAVLWVTVGVLLWLTYFSGFQSFIPQNIGMAPFCAVLIYCLARYPSYVQRVLSGGFLRLLGEASYSLYLVHIMVLQMFFAHGVGPAGDPEWWVVLYQVGAMMVTLHVFCFGLLHFVERPARTLLRGMLYPARSGVVPIRHRLGAAA